MDKYLFQMFFGINRKYGNGYGRKQKRKNQADN